MKSWSKIALIPAYNPEYCLVDLVQTLKKKGFWILVVDDGSSEEHKIIFRDINDVGNVLILTHIKNEGKGSALKTGLSYIQTNISDYCIVVTVDADGQHSPSDVEKICKEAQRYPGYLILGSRKIQKETPFKSKFGNRITRIVYGLITGVHLYDTQTGLRAFDNTILSDLLEIPGERYEYEMNVLLECSRKQIFMKILKFSASSFLSFLLDYGMYSAFLWVMRGTAKGFSVLCSNVAARIISGCFNYHINRKLVFQKETNTTAMAAEYVFLAAGILAGNTLILELFVGAGMNRYVAKPCTELLFFMISWFVQRTFIFKQKKTRILKC